MHMYIICLIKVACGTESILVLTDKNEVYMWDIPWAKSDDEDEDNLEISCTKVNNM